MNCDNENGSGDCDKLARERIRYFTGRHMTARDFQDADAYHRTMRHLHNRVLHGVGIACGLEVALHRRPECGVIVRCGLAIDCCGREIVVPKPVSVPIDWDAWPKLDGEKPDPEYVLLLCLEYCEQLTEKVPVLYSTSACSSASYEEGRIRESYRLTWRAVRESELGEYGWYTAKLCPPRDDDPEGKRPCECEEDEEPRCCIDPHCPPCHCVPLAVVRGAEPRPKLSIDGRPRAAQSPQQLTHICWISWPHGGVVRVSEFRELRVRFDRRLRDPQYNIDSGPDGINERTFMAQAGQQREDLDFVMYRERPKLLPDGRTAVFEVLKPEQYVHQVVHVTLRCDFILDCDGNAVDGEHLRGRLPSGNGIEGGTFESWFLVVHDDEYDRVKGAGPGATP